MAKKAELKTKKSARNVSAFLDSIEESERREDAKKVLSIMKRVTKKAPVMWADSMVGFGSYTYYRSNGEEGEYFATGFSPRKQALTIYIMPGYQNYEALLKKLGPHSKGASCLYIKHLKDIDLKVLEELIKRGLADLKKTHAVR